MSIFKHETDDRYKDPEWVKGRVAAQIDSEDKVFGHTEIERRETVKKAAMYIPSNVFDKSAWHRGYKAGAVDL